MTKIAIIGAGLSGLSAAHLLKDYAEITLFEKAKGVGGRMSTRRAEPYFFDHGAQYFTARTKPFQDFIQPLLNQGIIERWNARYIKFEGNQIIVRKKWSQQEARYVGVPAMNQVGKFLAKGLNINLNTRIVSLKYQDKWQLTDEQGQQYYDFDWVICTVPSPQAIAVLPKSFKYYADIKAIKMQAFFSLMLGFKQDLPLEFEAAHVTNSDISWIAVNSHKPSRSNHFTLMVNSSGEYGEAHIDDNHEEVMQHLIAETSHIIGYDVGSTDYKTIHRWLYANNAQIDQKGPIFLDQEHKLAVCGDWCLGGRVESAFTSAYNLILKMKEKKL